MENPGWKSLYGGTDGPGSSGQRCRQAARELACSKQVHGELNQSRSHSNARHHAARPIRAANAPRQAPSSPSPPAAAGWRDRRAPRKNRRRRLLERGDERRARRMIPGDLHRFDENASRSVGDALQRYVLDLGAGGSHRRAESAELAAIHLARQVLDLRRAAEREHVGRARAGDLLRGGRGGEMTGAVTVLGRASRRPRRAIPRRPARSRVRRRRPAV